MDSNNKEFDLSLIKNQNELAIKIAKFFTIEELDDINISNVHKKNRNLEDLQYVYYSKEFDNDKSVKLIDTLILDIFPAYRYVTIRLSIGEKEVIEYRCKFCKNIIKQLYSLFARIYNYKNWSTDIDSINKSHIINNFIKRISLDVDKETLEETKFVVAYTINNENIKNDDFNYDFSISNVDFHIESNEYQISFSYKLPNKKFNKIYFDKTDTGVSNISFIINQAINI